MSELSFTQVGEILQLLQRVEAAEVTVEWGDLKIHVRRDTTGYVQPESPRDDATHGTAVVQTPTTSDTNGEQEPSATDPPTTSPPVSSVPEHWTAVEAPMVGTFYQAPKPGERPFVEVGDLVREGDTVALIEVMKLFTELKAEVTGKVARVDADDGNLVEFGQALLWIEPA